jgi:hypothetical protein
MFVFVERRDSLRRKLSADPVCFLDQANAATHPARRQRRRDAAGAAADNQDIARNVLCGVPAPGVDESRSGIARKGHAHHINKRIRAGFHRAPRYFQN